tara:strand:- start:1007 stop:1300 length:294 start_codon:yes stop_codon:yes gene_type:complete
MTKKTTSRRTKPTVMELKEAINGLIVQVNNNTHYQKNIDRIISSYIDYRGDGEAFKDYLIKLKEDIQNESKKQSSKNIGKRSSDESRTVGTTSDGNG